MQYNFRCDNCRSEFDVVASMTDIQCIKVFCPKCYSNNVHRKYGLFSFILRGKGFYKTDNQKVNEE